MEIQIKFNPNSAVEVGDFLNNVKGLLRLLQDTYCDGVVHDLHKQSKNFIHSLINAYIDALEALEDIDLCSK